MCGFNAMLELDFSMTDLTDFFIGTIKWWIDFIIILRGVCLHFIKNVVGREIVLGLNHVFYFSDESFET